LELPSESFLHFGLEALDAHAINGVLDTSVLSAVTGANHEHSSDRPSKRRGPTLHDCRYRAESSKPLWRRRDLVQA
jgi:hypothetical protein